MEDSWWSPVAALFREPLAQGVVGPARALAQEEEEAFMETTQVRTLVDDLADLFGVDAYQVGHFVEAETGPKKLEDVASVSQLAVSSLRANFPACLALP